MEVIEEMRSWAPSNGVIPRLLVAAVVPFLEAKTREFERQLKHYVEFTDVRYMNKLAPMFREEGYKNRPKGIYVGRLERTYSP